jgi:aminopeptidase N
MNKSYPYAIIHLPILLLIFCAVALGKDSIQKGNIQPSKDNYDVLFYQLDLNVSDSSTYIKGSTLILLKSVVQPLQQVVLDFADILILDSVMVNGQQVIYSRSLNKLIIDLNFPVNANDQVTAKIYYHGLGKYSEVTSGIYNKYVSLYDKHITWTLSEPFAALNWFPCKQSLMDKADSVYVFLSTDSTLKAGSNGLLTAQVPLPGKRIRYEWKSRFSIDYYLISFTVSNYMDYSFYAKKKAGNDSILIQNYIYNDTAYFKKNKPDIDKTGDIIMLFSDLFGNYPFAKEKYGHCVAPFGGGMEHQTMTTLINFSFLLVAHELAHQWFGDYVTCSTWQDIWINEGFASYAEYLANQYLKSQDVADTWITGTQDYVKSVPDGSVFVPESYMENEDRIFNSRLTYKKGAAIIHMIRQEVGNDSLFFKVLSGFIEKYKNSTASGTDFKNYLEDITGIGFDQFFNQWYFGQGFPIHNINWNYKQDTLYINSLQTTSAGTPFFNLLIEFKITHNNQDTLISLRQTSNFTNWKLYLPGTVSAVSADPRHWLLFELTNIANTEPEKTDAKFSVVPNPARNEVKIQFKDHIGNYLVYLTDSTGKILDSEESASQNMTIYVNKYPPGMYFIIVKEGTIFHNEKFIIK